MVRFLERLLNLHRGDFGRGALLFAYLFLIISSYVIGKAARSAFFLGKFQAEQLPFVIIAIAVLVGFVVAGYVRIGRRSGLRNLLVGTLLFFALNALAFWWLARFYQFPWLYRIFYVWVGIYGVLAPAQVWTLANYVLTTREAKRLFGLVGSGAIAGWIFGGYFTSRVAARFGAESLLLGMTLCVGLCAVLVVLIWRQRQAGLIEVEDAGEARFKEEHLNFWASVRLVGSSPYLRAIAAVICISSIVTTFAGWQFQAIAQYFLVETDRLAVFFGIFDFYCGLVCLVFQLLFTSRLLRRFGIGPALFVVPVALMAGSAGVLVWFTLAAAAVLKGSDQILRYSIDKSTVELLYLPVPSNVKLQVKSFIDTVIWRMGDGLAAVALLVFATYGGWNAQQVSWVNITFIFGWLVAAFVARRQYVATLRESIRQHRLDAERASAPVLDRYTTEILADKLSAVEPKEILYALGLFQLGRQRASHPAVRGLLGHPAAEVRQKAIAILSDVGDKTVLPQIETLLRDPDLEVRTEALLYLTHHTHVDPLSRIQELGDFPGFSIRSGMVAFLARPGATQNLEAAAVMLDAMVNETGPEGRRTRLEAARLIGGLPDSFSEQLRVLLADSDLEIVREAIRAVGQLRKRRFLLRILDRLSEPELVSEIGEAVVHFGDHIVGTLRDYLSDPSVPIEVRREIPPLLVRIATPAAERVLMENLLESDTALRFRIISSLNKLHQLHPEIQLDPQMTETVLAAEMMGHYRSYQILGTLGGNLRSDDPVVIALRESMNLEVERIFRLLGLLHPNYDLHSAYFGLQSDNPVVHDNSLEFLDNVLKPQVRNLLVPLLDSGITIAERVALSRRAVGSRMETREEAVVALVRSDDPWLKSCGAYAIGTFGLRALERELDSCLDHADPLLRETARQAKLRLVSPSLPLRS